MTEPVATTADVAASLHELGVRRVHVLAWRDLDDADSGGSEIHAHELMSRWSQTGLEIVHRTSAAPGLPATAQRAGYSVVRRGSRYSVFPRVVASEMFRRMGPYDALLEVWNGVPFLSPVWSRRPRVVFVHHVHENMWEQLFPGPVAAMGRIMETRLAPIAYRRELVLTPSEATRSELMRLGYHGDRVRAIENGISTIYSPGGTKSPVPLVVSVGRLAPVKQQDQLIEAAVVAKQRVPDLQMVIVGEGPLHPLLQASIERHGAHDWIRLAGRLTDEQLLDLYRSAWLVTSASRAEGWGLTLTEAAACGTPAVATDIPGHHSSVLAGRTGVLAPLDRLGDTIADVVLDNALREQLGRQALERAKLLSWDSAAARVLASLRDVVAARTKR